jgi:hypothetical protein
MLLKEDDEIRPDGDAESIAAEVLSAPITTVDPLPAPQDAAIETREEFVSVPPEVLARVEKVAKRKKVLVALATVAVGACGIVALVVLGTPVGIDTLRPLLGAAFGVLIGILIALPLAAVCAIVYFVPTIVASRSQHPYRSGILALNLLLGWSLLGWVAALVWALSPPGGDPRRNDSIDNVAHRVVRARRKSGYKFEDKG